MKKDWIPILNICLLLVLGCTDPSEYLPDIITVNLELSSTSTDFESLKLDIQEVAIKGAVTGQEAANSTFAGMYEMKELVSDALDLARFEVDYDSLLQVKVSFGTENSLVKEAETHQLMMPADFDGTLVIPFGRYIQDQKEWNIRLQLQSDASVMQAGADEYIFDPQMIIIN